MGVRTTASDPKVALYDSVNDEAFGPVFDTEEEADLFLTWYQGKYGDPRTLWWAGREEQRKFRNRYGAWHRACYDGSGFRVDIAIQMSRDGEPE